MNWDRLRIFYIVASEGGLSKASQVLNVTQSALSRQMSQLEHEVKQVLFLRMTRGLVLTEAGKKLLPIAEQLHKEAKDAFAALLSATQDAKGPLTLIASTTLHEFWLMNHLASFSEQYPDIQLSVIASEGADYHHRVRDDIYLQVSSFPSETEDMVSKSLCRYALHFYGSQTYVAQHGVPHKIQDLQNHRLIALEDTMNLRWGGVESLSEKKPMNSLKKHPFKGGKKMSAAISIEGEHSALKAVQNNMGIAVLPAYVAAVDPSLVQISLEGIPEGQNYMNHFICYPKRIEKYKRIQVLESFLLRKAMEDFQNFPY